MAAMLLFSLGCSSREPVADAGALDPERGGAAQAEAAAGVTAVPESPPRARRQGGTAQVQRLALLPADVLETSGLAGIDSRLWTLNDSGDDAVIYQLSEDGRGISKQLYLAGARNVDWESLALDDTHLYIADCGNNQGRRGTLDLYRVPLHELSAPDGSRVGYATARFRYGQRLEVTASDSHNFDCEAVTAVGDELWLFSKNRADGNTELYRLDKRASDQAVFPTGSYPVEGLITAADYDPVSRRLVLLGYSRQRFFGHSFIWFIPLSSEAGSVKRPAPDWSGAQRYRLSEYAQWEAISWDGQHRLLLTSERSPLSDAQLGEIRLDDSGVPLAPAVDPDDSSLW
ncbi:hypothetical protein [Marinobacterium rhizophilum]|uniref:Uncharacterized protein n=1 Tax=Marinobacterium rhizophilum TaxID=420402 RepID=A0ABY5HKR7_9GAMM|nr:hypothetical protein [Marinobacterium rhizophilum]UTW12990.1 hypothetical protein KDW95_04825 [Marinobacterium rhizophilum]